MSWHEQSAIEHAAAFKRGAVTSSSLVEHYIARIEAYDRRINAVVIHTFDEARVRAKAADDAWKRGEDWGVLMGVPITIKECWWLTGTLSTCVVPELRGFRATSNCIAVQRLLDAGAIILGKTNMPVSGADFQSFNDVYGTTNNPWDLTRSPGGSSGGAAASMAAGFAALELGSDIGGSIRNPAHFCGVCGHKPSQGFIPLQGHSPMSNHASIEQTARPQNVRLDPSFHDNLATGGPIARSCADLELAMQILAGPEPVLASAGWSFSLLPTRVREVKSLRMACWLDDPFCPVDTECVDLMVQAANRMAAAGAQVNFEARPVDFEKSNKGFQVTLLSQMGLFPELKHIEYQRAAAKRQWMKEQWATFFKDFDVLLCPVMPTPAMKHDHSDIYERLDVEVKGKGKLPYWDLVRWCGLTIFVDLPVTVVPVGITKDGLPCGVQIVAAFGQDLTCIEVGKMMEQCGCRFKPPPGMGFTAQARL